MFIAEHLQVKDWCQHKIREVDFVRGTNGIVGPNGKGKSNLISALFTAITGRVLLEPIEANINSEADKATIRMTFLQNGVAGEVQRAFTAKRDKETPALRGDCTTTASLTFGDLQVKGAKKTTDELMRITGMSPRTIEDHIFVSQDKITQLLFQTRAERMKSFLSLIPGVERAEVLRLRLNQEIDRFPDTDISAQLMDTQAQCIRIRQELETLRINQEQIAQYLASINIQVLNDLLQRGNAAITAKGTADGIEKQIANQKRIIDEETVISAQTDTVLASLLSEIETTKSMAELARTQLATIQQNRLLWEDKKRLSVSIDQLTTELTTKTAPVDNGRPWEKLPSIEARYHELIAQIAEHEKIVKLLSIGDKCPTCGNKFANAKQELESHKAVLVQLHPEYNKLAEDIRKLTTQQQAYTVATSQYTTWLDTTIQRLTEYGNRLQALKDVVEVDVSQAEKFKELVSAFESLTTKVKVVESTSQSHRILLSNAETKLETLTDQLKSLQPAIMAAPTAQEISQALETKKAYDSKLSDKMSLFGQITAKTDELTRLEASVLKLELTQSREKLVRSYRELLSAARDALHRDRLPQAVLLSYVRELDGLCNKFLALFGNPFAIKITNDMDMACMFPTGYQCGTDRLSGGQKCVLSVAVRFAINELFAKDLGLLVLDEPTAWMDSDNITYLGELIDRIHVIGKEAGVQTIVITHAQELVSCFEHVIEVN